MALLLITLLAFVELIVNVWLYYFYRCDFEDNEIFRHIDHETKRKICMESIGYGFAKENLSWIPGTRVGERGGGLDYNLVQINSHGFRGSEFTEDKEENSYRIFTIGGSTTFSIGVLDNQTYPFFLQDLYNQKTLGFNVEVINAGWPGYNSDSETKLIKDKLLGFDPDLFIIFDPWNDVNKQRLGVKGFSATQWNERWREICDLEKKYQFDTIITIQPTVGTGKKKLSEQEMEIRFGKVAITILDLYPPYVEKLMELQDHCTVTADLRNIFDHVTEPLFFGGPHVGKQGNKIIAEKFYQLSLPLVMKHSNNIVHNNDSQTSATLEINGNLDSENIDYFMEQSYSFLEDIISLYKTPRVVPLIFEK